MKRLFLTAALTFLGATSASAQMVQAVSYDFSTVENPLSDGGVFTTIADANFSHALEGVAGNLCEANTTAINAAAFYSGVVTAPSGTWPNDQYTEITLTKWSVSNSFAFLLVRQGSAASGTQYLVNLNEGAQQWSLTALVTGTPHTLVAASTQASAQGDVFRLAIAGNVLTLSRNGSSVHTFTDTNNYIVSGSPGFGLQSPTLITSVNTGLWAAGANQAATPTFSPVAGSYVGTQTVTITSTSGGTIYYTQDGTTPTHSSSSITSGSTISVSTTQTVKAIASAANNLDSAVGSAAYTISVPVSASGWLGTRMPSTATFSNLQLNFAGR